MAIQCCICGGLGLYQHLVIAFLLEARIIPDIYLFFFSQETIGTLPVYRTSKLTYQIFSNTLCIYFQKLLILGQPQNI